jgi:hypothetical protein
MARLPLLLAAAAALLSRGASASLTCPTASTNPHASCLCTSGCSIGGDTTFPWSAAVYPPVAIDLGEDTVCATITLPCTTAASTLVTYLGISGNIDISALT